MFKQFGKGRPRHVPGTMNKLEADYYAHLEVLLWAREIEWFKFEAMTLKLAPDLRYTADFMVMLPDGTIELHEVKGGFIEGDAAVKMKAFAEAFPFRLVLVTRALKRDGGAWIYKTIGGDRE